MAQVFVCHLDIEGAFYRVPSSQSTIHFQDQRENIIKFGADMPLIHRKRCAMNQKIH
jgi:hypothetical protein